MTHQPLNMEELYDELRHAILEKMSGSIGQNMRGCPEIVTQQDLNTLLPDRKISERDKKQVEQLVCQIYHELYLERIIITGTCELSALNAVMKWPWYRITDHGQKLLQTREYSPYDPKGYLRRLNSDIPKVDETIVQYVEESLKCLQMDCLLAAAVTLGCASEKAILLLIEQFGKAISDPKKRKCYEKETGSRIISNKYNVFRKNIDKVAKDLPKELRNPLESQLHGIFDLIRRIRNDAGHPTGEPITRAMMRASHIVFPDYCKYVYSLMDHFDNNGENL